MNFTSVTTAVPHDLPRFPTLPRGVWCGRGTPSALAGGGGRTTTALYLDRYASSHTHDMHLGPPHLPYFLAVGSFGTPQL